MENVIARLLTKCAFADHGCSEEEKLPKEMLLHEKVCEFRLIKCLMPGCDASVPMLHLVEHCKSKHGFGSKHLSSTNQFIGQMSLEKDQLMTLIDGEWNPHNFIPRFVKSRSRWFILLMENNEQGFFMLYVYILGSKVNLENEEFGCRIKIDSTFTVNKNIEKNIQ